MPTLQGEREEGLVFSYNRSLYSPILGDYTFFYYRKMVELFNHKTNGTSVSKVGHKC